nr:outer membrane protein transport protein [uncultured Desulfobulbus sp.]
MNRSFAVAGVILLAAASQAMASGYRIPEQSLNSTARAGSYVAYTPGVDATYYNPANVSWLENRWMLEADATWIHLSSIDYTGDARTDMFTSDYNGSSESEDFLLPTFFVVSPDYNSFRFGFSVTAPGGLSKRWQDPFPQSTAEEFTLKVFELNPTVSYRFCDRFSVAAGVRGVYTDGKVKSDYRGLGLAVRDLEGDSWDVGYNLAATIKPVEAMNIAVTYRSKVDLTVEGDATLSNALYGATPYRGDAEVEIPLPAVLAVAVSYTFWDQLTVELEYDRTYWSDYKNLDFNYGVDLTTTLGLSGYDLAIPKKWKDTDAWRISLTYDMKNNFILMAGFAIDENPVPSDTLGFELPDSDALLYSLGVRYTINEDMEMGVAYLYDDKESRTVTNSTVQGTFKDASAHLVTLGFTWKF